MVHSSRILQDVLASGSGDPLYAPVLDHYTTSSATEDDASGGALVTTPGTLVGSRFPHLRAEADHSVAVHERGTEFAQDSEDYPAASEEHPQGSSGGDSADKSKLSSHLPDFSSDLDEPEKALLNSVQKHPSGTPFLKAELMDNAYGTGFFSATCEP